MKEEEKSASMISCVRTFGDEIDRIAQLHSAGRIVIVARFHSAHQSLRCNVLHHREVIHGALELRRLVIGIIHLI